MSVRRRSSSTAKGGLRASRSPMASIERVERPLALTIGDPAGIGPDIALGAFAARKREQIPLFVLIGDPAVLTARARALGLDAPLAVVSEIREGPRRFRCHAPG